MAAATVTPLPGPEAEPSAPPDDLPRPSVATPCDSQDLCKRAETCELESEALLIDPVLFQILDSLLLETYAMLRPKPVDYEHRYTMIDIFNKIAKDISGRKDEFPVVEPFGSFTMDLFTTKSDLDLSVNFSNDMDGQFARKDKISFIRKLANVLRNHQRRGRCYGVLPIVSAIVPVLKVTDKGTGVECDISVENKDGMSRSVIFKLVSSIDERFQILCYLMKSWAKKYDVNCPRDRTMSSMAIISLVAFHLQTRHPPILPAFSGLLKDGSDFASVERNIVVFKGFGSTNKESVAELFVSLMTKLLAVENLWEQGLCASNFDGFWISKTWSRGIGNLSVEDFLDRSQNFARAVGKVEMQNICECLKDTVSKLTDFFRGNIDAPTLKILIFGALNKDVPVSHSSSKHGKSKRKRDSQRDPGNSQKQQKKGKHTVQPGRAANKTAASLPTTTVLNLDVPVSHPSPKHVNSKPKMDSQCDPGSTQKQQKKGKHTVQPDHAANKIAASLPTTTVLNQDVPVSHPSPKDVNSKPKVDLQCDPGNTQKQQKKGKHTVQPGHAANKTAASLPTTTVLNQDVPVSHPSPKDVNSKPKMNMQCDPRNTQKQQKKGKHTVQPGHAANKNAASLPTTTVLNQHVPVSHPSPKDVNSKPKMDSQCDPGNTQKQQKKGKHTVQPGRAANKTAASLPATTVLNQDVPVSHPSPKQVNSKRKMDSQCDPENTQKQQKKGKHTVQPGSAANKTAGRLPTTTVFRPPHVHQVGYTQPFNQFVHPSQHPIPPRLAYGYGSPQEHLHPAPYMTGQPHGSFMHWTDPGIHLQQQAQHMFVPLPVQQPAINRSFHPYGFNRPQQVQFDDYSRLPYGFNPNYEFNGAQQFPFDDYSRLPYGFNPNYEFNGAHRFQFDDYSRLPNGFDPYYRRV